MQDLRTAWFLICYVPFRPNKNLSSSPLCRYRAGCGALQGPRPPGHQGLRAPVEEQGQGGQGGSQSPLAPSPVDLVVYALVFSSLIVFSFWLPWPLAPSPRPPISRPIPSCLPIVVPRSVVSSLYCGLAGPSRAPSLRILVSYSDALNMALERFPAQPFRHRLVLLRPVEFFGCLGGSTRRSSSPRSSTMAIGMHILVQHVSC